MSRRHKHAWEEVPELTLDDVRTWLCECGSVKRQHFIYRRSAWGRERVYGPNSTMATNTKIVLEKRRVSDQPQQAVPWQSLL